MDNSINVTRKILTILNIRYTNQYLKDSLLSHPNYPGLLAISDTLDTYNVNSLAVKITAEKLEELPLPCIVQVAVQGTPSFYVLKEFSKDNEVVCINDRNKIITPMLQSFCSGGKTVNCNTVLGSKYASILSGNLTN